MQSVLSMLGITSCIDSVYFRDYLEDYKEKVKKLDCILIQTMMYTN